ncbi:hypothetical protein K469DRAFT_123243 [Zopfia rhizophila CBS 207.26]|uniref:Uncharacterized protein n=1 Tax=Zopfia rhizophila CBS 207.26 TaxID=1314779 RepID=A0A6A6E7T7_9PEZI|nr:hypothetical protein K469DRAFT_123243 [Zopfia rhizophila CBS 207.26]
MRPTGYPLFKSRDQTYTIVSDRGGEQLKSTTNATTLRIPTSLNLPQLRSGKPSGIRLQAGNWMRTRSVGALSGPEAASLTSGQNQTCRNKVTHLSTSTRLSSTPSSLNQAALLRSNNGLHKARDH